MTPSGWTHWLAWIIGGLFVVAGIVLPCRTLFRSRNTGPRCPTCSYDMSGAESLTCSECGRTATRPELFRAPRRWRRILGSAFLIVVGAMIISWPFAESRSPEDWTRVAPSSILVALFQLCDSDVGAGWESAIVNEVYNRMSDALLDSEVPELNGWQRRWTISHSLAVIEDHLAEDRPRLARTAGEYIDLEEALWDLEARQDKLMFGYICQIAFARYVDSRPELIDQLHERFPLGIEVLTPARERWGAREIVESPHVWDPIFRPTFSFSIGYRGTGRLVSPAPGEQPWWMPVAFDESGSVMGAIDDGPLPEPGRYEFVYEFSVEAQVLTFIPIHGNVLRPRWLNLGTFRAPGAIEIR
ncbi:MAG: hypothetical protein ACYS0G_08830 [Planctomycetota bacterium]